MLPLKMLFVVAAGILPFLLVIQKPEKCGGPRNPAFNPAEASVGSQSGSSYQFANPSRVQYICSDTIDIISTEIAANLPIIRKTVFFFVSTGHALCACKLSAFGLK